MDGLNIGNVVAVSRYWTPRHVDMTYAPVEYARTKPSWIDRLEEHRSLAHIDSRDRMKRRAQHSNALVKPEEIRVLPPVAAPPAAEPEPAMRTLTRWFSSRIEGIVGTNAYVRR